VWVKFFDPDSRTVALPKKSLPCSAPFSSLLWLAFKPSHMPQPNTSAPFSEFLPHLEYASDCMSFCCQPPCMPCDCQFRSSRFSGYSRVSLSLSLPRHHRRIIVSPPPLRRAASLPPLTLSQQQQAAAVSHPQRASGVDARHTNSRKMNTKQLHSAASATSA
jgi:hypothetical protein